MTNEKKTKGGSYYFCIDENATMVIGFKKDLYKYGYQWSDTYKYVAGLTGSTCGNTKVYRSLDSFFHHIQKNKPLDNDKYNYAMVDVKNVRLNEADLRAIQSYSHEIRFEDSPNPNVPYLEQYPI